MQTQSTLGTSGASTSSGAVDQAKEKAQDVAGQAKDKAQEVAEQGRSMMRDEVDRRSGQAGDQLQSTVEDLRTVGKELRNQGKDTPAKIADQVADRGERIAGYLRSADADQILSDAESFARKNPWAVIAGGLAIGFLGARFMKASSQQRFQQGGGRSTAELRSSLSARGYTEATPTRVSGYADSPVSEGS